MHKPTVLLLSSIALLFQSVELCADVETTSQDSTIMPSPAHSEQPSTPFTAFTGKITRNKVRLRLQPNIDSPILKEFNQGDLLIVLGETDDFYAVQPPAGIKAYIFRTFVLDNVVEANRVNVRLQPDLESPIIGQLRSGDRIEGIISPQNNKWLEIATPETSRFYVAKDYVEKLGDTSVMSAMEKRRDEVNILLNNTYLASQKELQKAFPEINLDSVYANFNKLIEDYKDFPEQVARARELLSSTQDTYLQKKIAFLEAKTKIAQDDWQSKNSNLTEQMKSQQQKLSQLENQLKRSKGEAPYIAQGKGSGQVSGSAISNKMTAWIPVEMTIYEEWAKENDNKSQDDFYREQNDQAVAIKGIIEPYNRVIKNRPGDFVLVNQSSHLPIAYIYSTKVNLQDRLGQEVTVYGVARNNNNFAFPAYFVLSVE